MALETQRMTSRRLFLDHLLRSPLLLAAGAGAAPAPIASPKEALSVFDFIPAAEKNVSPAHWAYLMSGVDDNLTREANRDGFRRFQIRPRRFVDVRRVDTSVRLFGQRYPAPITLAPVGSQRAFHDDGELAVARAAGARELLQILATTTSRHVRDVAREHRLPLWYQLYPTSEWTVTRHLIKQAEEAGCPVLVLTADSPVLGNREAVNRARQAGGGECRSCHVPGPQSAFKKWPMFAGVDYSGVRSLHAAYTWELIGRIRGITRAKLVVKGVMTGEDAEACARNGMDGIIVSNHGGRQEESLLSTIEVLPEIVAAIKGRMPVLIDGGFRRGTDVFKALALGASAISIGRPYLWGLGAFGQPGVERVLEIMQAELVLAMQLAGAAAIGQITPDFVRRRSGE